jgi:hypothetical protein
MPTTNQLNVRIKPEYRRKLEALAVGEGVSIGGAIALLLDNTPMQPVTRTGLGLQKNNRSGVVTTQAAVSSVR